MLWAVIIGFESAAEIAAATAQQIAAANATGRGPRGVHPRALVAAADLRRTTVSRHNEQMGGVRSRASIVWAEDAEPQRLARALLRNELARWYDVPAGDVVLDRICRHCGSAEHGGLVVSTTRTPRLHVSMARSSDIAVAAVCDTGPVGLDVERLERSRFIGVGPVLMHEEEQASTYLDVARTWVRKEAVLKATGDGLHADPRRLRLSPPDQPPGVVSWPDEPSLVSQIWLADLALTTDHAACLAGTGRRPRTISLRRAAAGEVSPPATR